MTQPLEDDLRDLTIAEQAEQADQSSDQASDLPTWRERQRAATAVQIKDAARSLLLGGGPEAVSLRGIARELGMTAPGLYRYFASLDDLLIAVCQDLFSEASAAVVEAVSSSDDPSIQMQSSIRAFRSWAVGHPAEFRLMFSGIAGLDDDAASCQFAQVFLQLFAGLLDRLPLPPASPTAVPTDLQLQVQRFAQGYGADIPLAALIPFVTSWVRLYGLITLEALGQLKFMLEDVGPLFESELQAVTESFGLVYTAPPSRSGTMTP